MREEKVMILTDMGRHTKPTSISIPPGLLAQAHERMAALSIYKFSTYVQWLVERDLTAGGDITSTRKPMYPNPPRPQPESVQAVSMAAESKGEYRVRRKKTA
jgi:hypothetical protein